MVTLIAVSGCTEDGDICLLTVSEIDSVESAANLRLTDIDISNPDQFSYAQARASKDQYSQALVMLTSGGGECMSDVSYKNRLRYLEVKYGFLDLFIRFGETEERLSTLLHQDYTEFNTELRYSMNSLESMKSELVRFGIMANDVDKSLLNPDNQDTMNAVKSDIEIMSVKINTYLSALMSYQ